MIFSFMYEELKTLKADGAALVSGSACFSVLKNRVHFYVED